MTDFYNSQNFIYCPKCGAANLYFEKSNLLKCKSCSFEFYHNTAAAVAGLIIDENGRLLLTKRANEPAKGKWDLPGGFIDPDECAEDALKREIKEELGLEVISIEYLCSFPNRYEYKSVEYCTLDLAFICQVSDITSVRACDDVEDIVFQPLDKITAEKISFESIRKIIAIYAASKK